MNDLLPWVVGPFATWVFHRAYHNGDRFPFHAAYVIAMIALASVCAFILGRYGEGVMAGACASYIAWLAWNNRRPKRRALKGAGRVVDLGHRLTVAPE